MLGTKTITASLFVNLFGGALVAQTPDYFPLQKGNAWMYRATQGRLNPVQTISVEDTETIDGRTYWRVEFFGRSLLLRRADDGNLFSFQRDTGQEKLFLPLGAPEGQRTESEFDSCTKSATVKSRSASLKTQLGEFGTALQLGYEPVCADAGFSTQYFLPYVGLVQQEGTSIAGPVRYELVYSRTGLTTIETGQVGFTVALNGTSFPRGETTSMIVRMTLRSSAPEPITLFFPSGQSFDVRIMDERQQTVYVWSADKLFSLATRTEAFGPGEKTYAVDVPLGQLAPGRYTAEAFLTTQPRIWTGITQFEVR
jgi:hypothetical protein